MSDLVNRLRTFPTLNPEGPEAADRIEDLETEVQLQKLHISALQAALDTRKAEVERLASAHDWQYKVAGERLRRCEKLEAQVGRLKEALASIRDVTYYKLITDKTEAWSLAHMVNQKARASLSVEGDDPWVT